MARESKKVFLAASMFISFVDRAHPKHDQSAAFFRYFAQEQYVLFTDSLQVTIAYNYMYKEMSRSLARDFMRVISLCNINFLPHEESDLKLAFKTIVNYQSNELTFSDAMMAVVCYKKNIYQICSFDYLHNLFGITLYYLPI
jgi:predicted nucleic acid-binding protein